MDQKNGEKKISFKDTLNLPRTDFPIRSNPKIDDPEMVRRWQGQGLYKKTFEQNKGKETFILHDGPPYANAHIHLGTALNKILKDITAKSQRMFGKHVPVTPGWDCHGLPIELKVSAEFVGINGKTLMLQCRDYARKWIDIQREEFKNLGVLMDWNNPYLTMDFGYEADTLRAFGEFVRQGFIKRQNKTVPWCPSCQTVLASAEIEYADRKDPSIYVLFSLQKEVVARIAPELKDNQVSIVVWTTTPWTLPLNRAVLLKPDAHYVILDIEGAYVIVGATLADALCSKLNVEKKIVKSIVANDLVQDHAKVHHPFVDELTVPLVLDEHVALDEGTAAVHCAPGCGPQDYDVAIKNKLEIYSPVTPDGLYDIGIVPQELQGKPVTDGQGWVITELKERNKLLHKESITHSYPHCWRCRGGLIFRATKQWFCDLSQHGLKNRALKATESIKTIPENSINRLQATLEGRLEWCLSRQRTWGTPIPALICNQCDYTYISQDLINKVAARVENKGIEVWRDMSVEELLPKNFVCPSCESTDFKKEYDILDVWFDSGISHYAVLKKRSELRYPADLYLEGKDQHRGWFQSSLLTSMVLEKEPCTKGLYTHGYTVDAKGRKMSKSLGNVITPQEVIDKVGTDGLRLWVTTIGVGSDAPISDVLLKNVQEVMRKVRNTCRFLLSNLYDFDVEKDSVPFDDMRIIDQHALVRLAKFNEQVKQHYATMDYTAVFHALADYCTTELSSYYLDIVKDRLYVEKADGRARRSAQTVCYYILDTLVRLVAPIMSFTAERISDHYQKNKAESIHLQKFANLQPIFEWIVRKLDFWMDEIEPSHLTIIDANKFASRMKRFTEIEKRWSMFKKMRSAILKKIEVLREKGLIKHSLEAKIKLYIDSADENFAFFGAFVKELAKTDQTFSEFLKEYLIVSHVELSHSRGDLHKSDMEGLCITVDRADGSKCPRCWQWNTNDHEHNLCRRCQRIIESC